MTLGPQFADVLCAAQRGEDRGFLALYRDLNPPLLRYLATQDRRSAEDVASETWLAAARGMGSFSGPEEAFRAWIFTIARRRMIEHWRQNSRRPHESAVAELPGWLPAPDDPEATGIAAIAAKDAAAMISALLPPDQAEVVLLRILAGLDVTRVAEILGKRPGNVRVLQHKALRRLAEKLNYELLTR